MQHGCISLPTFANREMRKHPLSPTAGLGFRAGCTTFEFAQKKDVRPVGGRGISAFSTDFFLAAGFFAKGPSLGILQGELVSSDRQLPSVALVMPGLVSPDILFVYTVYRQSRHSRWLENLGHPLRRSRSGQRSGGRCCAMRCHYSQCLAPITRH